MRNFSAQLRGREPLGQNYPTVFAIPCSLRMYFTFRRNPPGFVLSSPLDSLVKALDSSVHLCPSLLQVSINSSFSEAAKHVSFVLHPKLNFLFNTGMPTHQIKSVDYRQQLYFHLVKGRGASMNRRDIEFAHPVGRHVSRLSKWGPQQGLTTRFDS